MLKQRLLTAAVLIPLFVWGVLALPSTYFAMLLTAVLVVAALEWARLVALPVAARRIFVALIAGGLLFAVYSPPPVEVIRGIAAAAVLWWGWATVSIFRYQAGAKVLPATALGGALAGVAVLLPPWLALTALHRDPATGPAYVLFLFVLVWAADSGAYFVGRRFGRRKLAARVSPGKTWEGVMGGAAASLLVAVAAVFILNVSAAVAPWFVVLCVVVVVISVVGDLLESLFKREAGVKDSGRFLPGHGGALDRIDSITAAAPVFYVGLALIAWLT